MSTLKQWIYCSINAFVTLTVKGGHCYVCNCSILALIRLRKGACVKNNTSENSNVFMVIGSQHDVLKMISCHVRLICEPVLVLLLDRQRVRVRDSRINGTWCLPGPVRFLGWQVSHFAPGGQLVSNMSTPSSLSGSHVSSRVIVHVLTRIIAWLFSLLSRNIYEWLEMRHLCSPGITFKKDI